MNNIAGAFRAFFWGLTVLVLAAAPCFAKGPAVKPILVLETQMHTAPIHRIATDAQNRFLATGSEDKTARVWELSTGKLLKVLRPPIGTGTDGVINAVAMSPDGRVVACGGLTNAGGAAFNVFIFDRETGKMKHRIGGLPGPVQSLAYSKKGDVIAVSMSGPNGVRIYSATNYTLVKEDRDYGGTTQAEFDDSGRLATVSFDGHLRLYDARFVLMHKVKTAGGMAPSAMSFASDGSKIAVGFADSSAVDVYSGNDLSRMFSQQMDGIGTPSVCWAADGNSLYASNKSFYVSYTSSSPYTLKRWTDGGKGRFQYLSTNNERQFVSHILPLRGGGVVFSTDEPSFGTIDAENRPAIYKAPSIAHFWGDPDGLRVSADGSVVRFNYASSEIFVRHQGAGGFGLQSVITSHPMYFSIMNRELQEHVIRQPMGYYRVTVTDEAEERPVQPLISYVTGFEVTDWKDSSDIKLNGTPLKLDKNEVVHARAFAPDSKHVLIGTSSCLRFLDSSGNEKWKVRAPSTRAVNVARSGGVAVAAHDDGTVRWYHLDDGRELLALFPHVDMKRWVVWTPRGYYDAAPGAEELIGWHVNRGMDDAADFFPASRFRNVYYRPDIIAQLISTTNEGEAIKIANTESGKKTVDVTVDKILPPVVSIISPRDNMEVKEVDIAIKFTVRTPSGEPVTGIKVLIDGRPVRLPKSMQTAGQRVSQINVVVPERDSEISVIAENRFVASDPAKIRLRWTGKVKRDEFIIKPKLYILSIGVSNYRDKSLKLGYAAKDANDFVNVMIRQKGGLYRDVSIKLLTDERATKDEILDGLDWITRETTSKDVAIIFFAGHGVNDNNGIYHFLPSNIDLDRMKRTGVPFTDVKNTLSSLAGKAVLFVDTCHSGNIMGSRRSAADINALVNELSSAENGAVVFSSSTGRQYSVENHQWGNGAFTKALVEGIGGKADLMGKGRITINMLDLYLSERVKELTKGLQTPTTAKPTTIPDFPLAILVDRK